MSQIKFASVARTMLILLRFRPSFYVFHSGLKDQKTLFMKKVLKIFSFLVFHFRQWCCCSFSQRSGTNAADNLVLPANPAVSFSHNLSHRKYFGYSIYTALKLKLILNYYIERQIAILQLKFRVGILINEDKFRGKIHSNKDWKHTAIFTKVIRPKQKKMRNINGWLTMSNQLGLCIIRNCYCSFL